MMHPGKEWPATLARPDEGVRASMATGTATIKNQQS